jgi:mannosidase alpha-like ER degradation enhancer 1
MKCVYCDVSDVVVLHLGVDSFYEYLYKAHILFGKDEFWRMFHSAYIAVQKYFRHGPWYSTNFLPY